ILLQFIFESVFLTFIGGFMGILIGYILSKIITQFAQNAGFFVEFSVTWYSILIGFGFSAAVGIIFGYYPARKASRLSPMEALRKE
ncbi:MAG: FtsX-like permease family protein, partial [Parcubacteria group bacterium]